LADLQEEISVVPVSVGHAFDQFDFVVDALQDAGVQRVAAVAEDARQVAFELAGECFERFDAALRMAR